MPTKRTPRQSKVKVKITPFAVQIFTAMRQLPSCTCSVMRPGIWCQRCEEFWDLHSALHDELKLRRWQWPAIKHPDDRRGVQEWAKGGTPAEMWRQLEEAAAEGTT